MYEIDELKRIWRGQDPLEAGRLIFEVVPGPKRPMWASKILSHATVCIQHIPEIDFVIAIANNSEYWSNGHTAFDQVRELTLKTKEPLIQCLLLLAENTAKVIYNETSPPDPFDSDSGWWIAENLWSIAVIINDIEFEKEAWHCLTDKYE